MIGSKEIGNRVRILREIQGLNQRQLQEKLGIGNGRMSALETGKYSPSWDDLCAVSSHLWVGPDQLVGTIERFSCAVYKVTKRALEEKEEGEI